MRLSSSSSISSSVTTASVAFQKGFSTTVKSSNCRSQRLSPGLSPSNTPFLLSSLLAPSSRSNPCSYDRCHRFSSSSLLRLLPQSSSLSTRNHNNIYSNHQLLVFFFSTTARDKANQFISSSVSLADRIRHGGKRRRVRMDEATVAEWQKQKAIAAYAAANAAKNNNNEGTTTADQTSSNSFDDSSSSLPSSFDDDLPPPKRYRGRRRNRLNDTKLVVVESHVKKLRILRDGGGVFRADRVLSNRGWASRSECFTLLQNRQVSIQLTDDEIHNANHSTTALASIREKKLKRKKKKNRINNNNPLSLLSPQQPGNTLDMLYAAATEASTMITDDHDDDEDDLPHSITRRIVSGPMERIPMNAKLFVRGQPVPERPLLLVYHKPKWMLSTMSDPLHPSSNPASSKKTNSQQQQQKKAKATAKNNKRGNHNDDMSSEQEGDWEDIEEEPHYQKNDDTRATMDTLSETTTVETTTTTTRTTRGGRPHLGQVLPPIYQRQQLHPVGRLDYDSSGLILFSSTGTLTQKLLHPSQNVEKEYVATVSGIPDPIVLEQELAAGVATADGTYPAQLVNVTTVPSHHVPTILANILDQLPPEYDRTDLEERGYLHDVKTATELSLVRLIVTEGKHRMVRRILANVGFPVLELKRTRQGIITLDSDDEELPPGEFRLLKPNELEWAEEMLFRQWLQPPNIHSKGGSSASSKKTKLTVMRVPRRNNSTKSAATTTTTSSNKSGGKIQAKTKTTTTKSGNTTKKIPFLKKIPKGGSSSNSRRGNKSIKASTILTTRLSPEEKMAKLDAIISKAQQAAQKAQKRKGRTIDPSKPKSK